MSSREEQLILLIGAVSGVGLALQGLSPTGSPVTDWLVLLFAATAAAWCSSTAPWWAISATAGIGAALAPPIAPLVLGVAVFLSSLAIGVAQRDQPAIRAVVMGAAMIVLGSARDLEWFGVTTLVSVLTVAATSWLGLRRRSPRRRRLAYLVAGATGAVVVVGTLGLVLAGASARSDLSEGNRTARAGLSQLKQGEFETARTSFALAADAFERSDADLGSVLGRPAQLVPLVSQHRRAGVELASAAAEATRTIELQLGQIDLDRLRIVDGRIDVAAVRELETPMTELQGALDELDEAVTAAGSPWLVGRVQDELTELRGEIDDQQQLAGKASDALAVAPSILGADEPRVYFVMFTTPAEARGTGGFMGNYAEVTIDDGRISMTDFGRHSDLNEAAGGDLVLHDPPPDWLARYGSEGFAKGPNGSRVSEQAWSIINLSPHFPSTAQVVADLYPQSGGRRIDGVISLDVEALSALIGLVGPIELDDGPTLDGTNAADYLLTDQYEFERGNGNAVRIDQLEVVAREVVDRLLNVAPPDPLELGRTMAPMAGQQRLIAWFDDDEEQAVIEATDLDGGLLDGLGGRDGLAVVVVNDGGNKLDTYLGREISLTTSPDGDRVDVRLTHDAPVEELPPYVTEGVPGEGRMRLWVTLNTTRPILDASLDGEPVAVSSTTEAGVWNYGAFLEFAPRSSHTLSFVLQPPRSTAGTVVDPQPLVRDEEWTVDGTTIGPITERTEILGSSVPE